MFQVIEDPAVISPRGVRRDIVAAPLAGRTPGEELVAGIANSGSTGDVTVHLAAHLPSAFPLFAERRRFPVRHLLKTVSAAAPRSDKFVYEPFGLAREDRSGTGYGATPEASFASHLADTAFTDLSVAIPLPEGLTDHPGLLASFIDHRLLVRLSVVENDVLLHGSADGTVVGLLDTPGVRACEILGPIGRAVTRTAALVEETGGSCDGVVAHPVDYWEMVRTGMLGRLECAGVTVSRTRMIGRGAMLLGDFRAAATLFLTNESTLTLLKGAGTDGRDVVGAQSRIGLAVHLPQHLVLLSRRSLRG